MKNDSPKSKAGLSDNKPEETCDWYINSPKHSNCFWIYVYSESSPDGSMPEMVQSEIAKLLNWSNTKTHFALKQAMTELIDALTVHKASQLVVSDPEQIIDIPDFEIVSTYKSGDSED